MSTAGFADEGWEPPAGDVPPPLPRRVRRWTVTREAMADALAVVYPLADRESVEDLAGEILGHLPPALSLAWPVDAAPVPVPDHECSFLAQSPDGACKFCGKTWARNVAELNLDRALAEFAATEPAPPRQSDWLDDLVTAGTWDRPSGDRLLGDLLAHAEARAVQEALLTLAAGFDLAATKADAHSLTRAGTIRGAVLREAAGTARRHAADGPPMPDVELVLPGAVAAPGASEPAGLASQDQGERLSDLRAPSDDPWIPADGPERDHGRAL